MSADLTFRLMLHGEEHAVCDLVHRAFDLSVASLYTGKGQRNFKEYADPGEMAARINSDHFVLLALAGGRMVGMIEMRHLRHVSLLFVDPEYQKTGIGGKLLERALTRCRRADPGLREITVNSSPNALEAYERMGFAATGREQEINGVRFVPMKKMLY